MKGYKSSIKNSISKYTSEVFRKQPQYQFQTIHSLHRIRNSNHFTNNESLGQLRELKK